MNSIYKRIFFALIVALCSSATYHPVYISVTELDYNANDKSFEITCKLFPEDFEHTLKDIYKAKVNILDPKYPSNINQLVGNYIQSHLKILIDNKPTIIKFIGFESDKESVNCYLEINGVSKFSEIKFVNNLLYEYSPQQMGIMHVSANGQTKSIRLVNPDNVATLKF